MITEDIADTPNALTVAGLSGPITSASFTPPPLSLVAVCAAAGWSGATQAVISCSDSGSHTWSNPIKATGTSGNGGTSSIFTSYFATSPGAITVTVSFSGFSSGTGGMFADFFVFQGAAASQTGAGTGSKLSTTGLNGTFNITTTQKNSWIVGVSDDSTNGALWTPATGVAVWTQWQDVATPPAGDNITSVSWFANVLPTATSYTVGGTWAANGSSNHTTQQCALEIIPAADLPLRPVINYIPAVRSSYL